MRIAFFSGDITRSGGTENVSIMIANELAQDNAYEISFISLFEEKPEPFFAIDRRIRREALYPQVTHGIQHYFDTVARLKRAVARLGAQVVIDIDGILDMYALPLKRRGVKVISWEHFNYLQNPLVPYRKFTRKWAAHSANAIVTLTNADRQLYRNHLNVRCPIIVIPNPMHLPEPAPAYDPKSTTIISSGRLTYQKGFDMLVDAAATVLPKHPDWQWLILGEGEDRPMLEEEIAKAGIGNQLVLKGRVADMDAYYRKAAFFVLSSRFEGLPMVLLEAKAYQLPIVSFDCLTGPAEIVQNQVNGLLVKDGDIPALASAVESLIQDSAKRERFSSHTLDDASRFDMASIIGQWKTLLAGLR
ncbi:glycosyltransferase family 4 protein [Bifidobacterium reuteri]|uniref:Glycosyltransferase family 4 protein n=1 Tax=Bifidobacterium reuteri TaxID=983706 RepID=A0A5J5E6Y1_9BIFI|nr:glycosyltransferase family 4 protein [Bifidobacterium reuteri]KAA8824949.1 glycosyltransferase family 4 protein [Bifidobacterium reuteri]